MATLPVETKLEDNSKLVDAKNTSLKSPKKRTKTPVYIYPISRDVKETEDSFRIKSIQYRQLTTKCIIK